MAVSVVIAVIAIANGAEFSMADPKAMESIFESDWGTHLMLAASQFSTMFVAIAAAVVHARRNFVERLDLRLPKSRHWAMGMMAVVPMSILATEAAIIVGQLDGFSLDFLQSSLEGINAVPYLSVLVFGCAFPGVFEELLFRGVIGRGMSDRYASRPWGIWVSVGFASLFFGMAHFIPAHVASAALMGVFLHLAFLYSRSFWVPVSMHIVNNAMAFTLSRYENLAPIPGYTTDLGGDQLSHIPPPLLAAGFFATLALVVCWRHFRTTAPDDSKAGTETHKSSAGLGWLLVTGLLLTQAILVVVLANSVEKM
jgi:membrane protease YdiL (CAAX protease family)